MEEETAGTKQLLLSNNSGTAVASKEAAIQAIDKGKDKVHDPTTNTYITDAHWTKGG